MSVELDTPHEAFAIADYEAVLDAGGIKHIEMAGDAIAIPDGAQSAKIIAHRLEWPDHGDGLVLKIRADVSFDGGSKWQLLVAFTARGGELKMQGFDCSWSGVTSELPKGATHVRVTLVPIRDLTTKVEIVFGGQK